MDKLTDEQLKVLGTAIGAEIVRSFSAKQHYYYGSQGWLSDVVKIFASELASKMTSNMRIYEDWFASLGKKILGKD